MRVEGPISVTRTMAEHQPPVQLGNLRRTHSTWPCFLRQAAVTEWKANKREGLGKKFVRNNNNSISFSHL